MAHAVDLFSDFPVMIVEGMMEVDTVCKERCLICDALVEDPRFESRSMKRKRAQRPSCRGEIFTFAHTSEYLAVDEDVRVRYHRWRRTPHMGVVVLLHDFTSHSDRLGRHIVPHLVRHGFSVVAYDQRNHGLSDSPLLELDWFDEKQYNAVEVLMQEPRTDLLRVLEVVSREFCDVPVFVCGSGLGGTIALDFGLSVDDKCLADLRVKGFACGSVVLKTQEMADTPQAMQYKADTDTPTVPAHGDKSMSASQISSIKKFFNRIGEALSFDSLDQKWTVDPSDRGLATKNLSLLSRDLRVEEMVRKDVRRMVTMNEEVAEAMCSVMESVYVSAGMWKRPLVLVHGTNDQVSPLEIVRKWQKTCHGHVELVEVDGARHWLHHEIQPARNQFLDAITDCFLANV